MPVDMRPGPCIPEEEPDIGGVARLLRALGFGREFKGAVFW